MSTRKLQQLTIGSCRYPNAHTLGNLRNLVNGRKECETGSEYSSDAEYCQVVGGSSMKIKSKDLRNAIATDIAGVARGLPVERLQWCYETRTPRRMTCGPSKRDRG
jgi:hypothetical protein